MALIAVLPSLAGPRVSGSEMDALFENPAEEMKPWCYWYWMNKDVTAEGITKDLEAMAKVGIKRAIIGNIYRNRSVEGSVDMFSPEWYSLKRHAFREAKRVGVEFYLFNGPGWSQSGGPWITPERSMRRVAWSEFEASGGAFSEKVRPAGVSDASQDIAVLAVPRIENAMIEGIVSDTDKPLSLLHSSWIWYPSENATVSAPAGSRYFTRVIELDPADLQSATIRLTADNVYKLSINGAKVSEDHSWQSIEDIDIKQYLKPGANTITIEVTNPTPGPAGLIAAVQLKEKGGLIKRIVTDKSWRVGKSPKGPSVEATELGDVQSGPWRSVLKDEANVTMKSTRLVFSSEEAVTARGLLVYGKASGNLYVLRNGERELIADIEATGGRPKSDFLPDEVETFSFEDVTSDEFEFVGIIEGRVVLTSNPTVAQVVEKQMGRMHPTPKPSWESYIFPDTFEPTETGVMVNQGAIIDLTDKLRPDGVLTCTLPPGEWTVMAFGMVPTGVKNNPAAPEATGLEVDKMSREHTLFHFDAYVGELIDSMTPEELTALTGLTIDSYEVGAQNWTDGFATEFEKRNGYNPIPLLPVLTGQVLDSAKTSDQFLWDLRRTVADMIAENYVGGLREAAHENGLTLWCENYGHWGFPGEFTIYGGYSDEVAGEFWTGGLGNIECRAASSAAHIYGKQRVFAEAFTSGLNLKSHPYTIKARGEEMFCEGINHFVLHVYAHQPRDGVPGNNPRFGTQFHRNTPWFNEARDWVRYLQRCHTMLQEGRPVAEVAVYIGDFAPQMTGPKNPVPKGYDYDYIGSDAILRTLDVRDGFWVVYDENAPNRISARWNVLAMPEVKYIRPKVLKRLEILKEKGGKIVEGVPVPESALRSAGILPAISNASCSILGKTRELDDGMLFFISNFSQTGPFEVTLRVKGKAPELFNPVNGEIKRLARYEENTNGTRISIDVKDRSDSYFIVFRDQQTEPSVVEASAPASVLDLYYNSENELVAESAKAGTYTLTMSNGTQREALIPQSPEPLVIEGPWRTEKRDEQGFSVEMETEFSLPSKLSENQRVYLDLGNVDVMAKVTLNGKTYETLWMPPFTLDVTDALKMGSNSLSILVTSTSEKKPKIGDVVQLKTEMKVSLVP